MKITFVCTGNTCRSPMAAAFAQRYADENRLGVTADSAGLCCGYGEEVSAYSREAIEARGIFYTGNSVPLTDKLIDGSDYIVAMTAQQKQALRAARADATEKIFCVADFTGKDVPDPYGQGREVYERTAQALEEGVAVIVDRLYARAKKGAEK